MMAKYESTRIKKGDTVVVLAGKNKGKQGQVMQVLGKKNRVLVERVNMVKKHQKPSQISQGGIIEKESSIDISNVALYCPKCGSGVRVGYKIHEDGQKVRYCKKCGEELDS